METIHDLVRSGRATQIIPEQAVHRATEQVAARITEDLQNSNPLVLVCMTGAMIWGAELISRLHFPLELDYVDTSRYNVGTVGSQLIMNRFPFAGVQGRTVIVVDDIFDKGVTLEKICYTAEQYGAKEIVSAVMLDKQCEKEVGDFRPDYIGLKVRDEFVFGHGLDLKGYMRNLGPIYQLNM